MGINRSIRVAADIILLILVALPVLLYFLLGDPYRRGFFCNDTTIRFPYKDSTVTSVVLYVFGTAANVLTIGLIEYILIWRRRHSSAKGEVFKKYISSLYRLVGAFLFGCALSHLTVDICKYSVGRLRPHFIDVCQVNWNMTTCATDPNNYVTEYVCTSTDNDKLREARLSFISGHASFSAYSMFYLIFYLQAYCGTKLFPLLRPIFQFILFMLALLTSLSRISDHKHHWSDVLAGFINGLVFAVLVAVFVAKMFNQRDTGSVRGRENIPLGQAHNNPLAC